MEDTSNNTFVLVINNEGVRSLVNIAHISHIKEVMSADRVTGVTAKILGNDQYNYIAAGPDSSQYFTWLMSKLNTLNYWEHVHEEDGI